MNVILLTGIAALVIGIACTWYQVTRLLMLDAERRGLRHPGLLGALMSGGQRGEGLIAYLLIRRKYRITQQDAVAEEAIARRKKLSIVGITFMAAGAAAAVIGIAML
ncbi:hypothetical protein SAMN02745687_02200 [Lachnospiraceae bacterium NK3A20]|jgi:hypothetical protein|nr:hypothetical protein SAMN02745687_02200 [Lachnospiraceae bacterium NK3A20]